MDIFNGAIEALFFIIGVAIGSFLNVVIVRLHQRKGFTVGRSHCPKCRAIIAWYDNVPLLSYVLLAGKCRNCRKPISLQYPLVELATALLAAWSYVQFGLSMQLLVNLVFIFVLEVIFVYDLRHQLIPDSLTIPAMIFAFIANILLGVSLWSLVMGAVIGGGFFALQYVVSKGKWIGDGDIRLGVVMGCMLGWQHVLVALFLAYLVGAVIGVTLIISRKAKMDQAVPFGPFLAGATIVALLYGRDLVNWYLNALYF